MSGLPYEMGPHQHHFNITTSLRHTIQWRLFAELELVPSSKQVLSSLLDLSLRGMPSQTKSDRASSDLRRQTDGLLGHRLVDLAAVTGCAG